MNVTNLNPLPPITKEINIQEKRMRTLNAMEKSLRNFANDLKDINSLCPFGAESLEVQTAVNTAQAWCDDFSKYLVEVNNYAIWSHCDAMKVLSKNEDILNPEEEVEDKIATLKSQVVPELNASRVVRDEDKKIQAVFESKLKTLEEDFKLAARTPTNLANRGNAHYPVVE